MGRKNAKVKRNTKFGLTTAEVTVCCGQAHSEHRHEAVLAVSPLCSHPGKLSFGGTGKEHCLPVCCHCHHLLWRSSKSVTVVTSCAAQRCPPAVPAHCSAQKPPPVVFRSAQHNGDSPRDDTMCGTKVSHAAQEQRVLEARLCTEARLQRKVSRLKSFSTDISHNADPGSDSLSSSSILQYHRLQKALRVLHASGFTP